jgi:hypothetical protein
MDFKKPHHVFPVAAAYLPRPQIHVEEHLFPAVDLPLQLGLQGVTLAQEEAVYFHLARLCAQRRRPVGIRVDLAAVMSFRAELFWLLVGGHEEHFLHPLHSVSPILWGRAQKKGTRRSVLTSSYARR